MTHNTSIIISVVVSTLVTVFLLLTNRSQKIPRSMGIAIFLFVIAIICKASELWLVLPRIIRHQGADLFFFPGAAGILYLYARLILLRSSKADVIMKYIKHILYGYITTIFLLCIFVETQSSQNIGRQIGGCDSYDIYSYVIGFGIALLLLGQLKNSDYVMQIQSV